MATDEATQYRSIMERRGLRVEEKKGKQKTLLGEELDYHTVTGVREGSYRVTLHMKPGPQRAQIVIHASTGEKARSVAHKLRDLGFHVDVEEERVAATTKKPSLRQIMQAIDAAEEATKH